MIIKPLKRVGTELRECKPEEATFVEINFPLEEPLNHCLLPVQLTGKREGTGNWSWNGDLDRPTIKPSILQTPVWGEKRTQLRCHCWVNDGKIIFLSDCSHALAGRTIDLPELTKSYAARDE